MPAATNKADLVAVCTQDYAKLMAVIAPIGAEDAMSVAADGLSIKDVIGHRAHWVDLYLSWVADGRAGKSVQTPAPGYKWNALPAYNASVRAAQADMNWDAAKTALAEAHGRLMAFFAAEDDASLYTAHLMPWMNNWTLGRWAEASGASHYRSAAKYIRARLREP